MLKFRVNEARIEQLHEFNEIHNAARKAAEEAPKQVKKDVVVTS